MTNETLATTGNTSTDPEQQQIAEQPEGTAEQQQQQQPESAEQQQQPQEQVLEYQDFTAPEDVVLDTELLGEFKAKAKEMGLPQDKAQQVVDLGVKLQQKWQTQHMQQIEQTKTQWAEQANADKEFGGEKIAENLSIAKKALDAFGTPELKRLLNDSGLGNHPEIIRAFYRAGKQISEDRFVGGGNGPSGSVDPAKVLFPTMN